jgi:hypothetical protein
MYFASLARLPINVLASTGRWSDKEASHLSILTWWLAQELHVYSGSNARTPRKASTYKSYRFLCVPMTTSECSGTRRLLTRAKCKRSFSTGTKSTTISFRFLFPSRASSFFLVGARTPMPPALLAIGCLAVQILIGFLTCAEHRCGSTIDLLRDLAE